MPFIYYTNNAPFPSLAAHLSGRSLRKRPSNKIRQSKAAILMLGRVCVLMTHLSLYLSARFARDPIQSDLSLNSLEDVRAGDE